MFDLQLTNTCSSAILYPSEQMFVLRRIYIMTKRSFFISVLTIVLSLCVIIAAFFGGKMNANASGKYTEKQYISYEIQNGDTLWSIAENMCQNAGISSASYIKEIRKINHLTSDLITEGNKLVLIQYHE